MTTPVIGSFKRPTANTPDAVEVAPDIVDKRVKVETPARAMAEGVQDELKDSLDRTKATTEKAKTYDEILSEHDIPLSKAHAVVDAMLEKGYYEETVKVTNTTTATFRTRLHADYIRYLRALETYNPKYVEEQQELQIRFFLAASIVAFKGMVLPKKEDAEAYFDSKLEWIGKQPEAVIRLLATKLSIFDRQIAIIMSEGVVENF